MKVENAKIISFWGRNPKTYDFFRCLRTTSSPRALCPPRLPWRCRSSSTQKQRNRRLPHETQRKWKPGRTLEIEFESSILHFSELSPSSPYGNLVEAASAGAVASIKLVANIAVSLVAFLSLLEFVNRTLTWFGNRAGMTTPLTFQFICSYVLWPLAFVMGVSSVDCGRVGELIGTKTFLNEYIAYARLG